MFGKKSAGNPEHERLLQGANKKTLRELALCEASIDEVVADEKPLVLFASEPGMGIVVITDAAVSSVDKSGTLQRLPYREVKETTIIDTPQQGVLVLIENGRPTDTISIPVATIEVGRRVCSTIDPHISQGSVPKKRKG